MGVFFKFWFYVLIKSRKQEIKKTRKQESIKTLKHMKRGHKYIIGIDEAGRGPLAGPVMATAVLMPRNFYRTNILHGNRKVYLRDSKKLPENYRNIWFEYIKSRKDIYSESSCTSPAVIDRINIQKAVNAAARRALVRLLKKNNISFSECRIYLDGSINIKAKGILEGFNIKTVVRGDEKINAVKAASIIAKVKRDNIMKKLHKQMPGYGFFNNKGYGTRKHREAIKKTGISGIHRITFLGNVV